MTHHLASVAVNTAQDTKLKLYLGLHYTGTELKLLELSLRNLFFIYTVLLS